jgi:hypothetical protein
MANRPRDLADQMAGQHNLNNGPLQETFTLSVEAARWRLGFPRLWQGGTQWRVDCNRTSDLAPFPR